MMQNKIFFTYIAMQVFLDICFPESLNFSSCESSDIEKCTYKDHNCDESSASSKIRMSPFHSRDVASFPDDSFGLFGAPKTRRRQGLSNILRVDPSSPHAELPEKVEELMLFVEFVSYVAEWYLHGCASVVLYDDHYETTRELLVRSLLRRYPLPRTHGKASTASRAQSGGGACRHYVLLLRDLALAQAVGNQSMGRVVVVTEASPTEVQRFLSAGPSHGVVNLLVVTAGDRRNKEPVLVLHTHEPFAGYGRAGRLLTSWRRCGLTRDVDLFPDKFHHGLGGRRLVAAVSEQPHYVILRQVHKNDKNISGSDASEDTWDGLEVRLLRLLSQKLNFTTEFRNFPVTDRRRSQASGVVRELVAHRAHVGLAGLYVTPASLGQLTLSVGHSIDCASFITRTSTALPRYHAIMGPFHWSVWLALTLTYLLAIFPVAFSHQHSLSDLLKNPWQMENMFWYVFGTFTNCFTFTGKQSWTSTDKNATRMFIGSYWMFSIIITACYTGSIIAFVTLPLYPDFINSARQVYEGGYKVAMLDGEGWQHYFNNSFDPIATKVLKKVEYLSAIEDGLKNLTKRRNNRYAVFGSRDKLEFLLKANFTHGDTSKRAFLHIAEECFVPFHVALGFPRGTPHSDAMNRVLLRALQSGLVLKLRREVDWELQRSSTGRYLQAYSVAAKISTKPPDRMLSLDDVQGNFLLLGAGFAIAFFSLFMEVFAWFLMRVYSKYYRRSISSLTSSIHDISIMNETLSQQKPEVKDSYCEIFNIRNSSPTIPESSSNI